MSRKKKTPSKTVKLDTIVPTPVITPLKVETTAAKIAEPAKKVDSTGVVKKAELIDRAVEKSGLKKRDVKPSVEAAMAVLSEALVAGEELNLPPLGKLRVVKSKDANGGAKILTLKLRTMKDGAGQPKSDDDAKGDGTITLDTPST